MSTTDPTLFETYVSSDLARPDARRDVSEPATRRGISRMVLQHGTAVSAGLLDPVTKLFQAPGIPGVVGYRAGFGCAVAIGDPVCPPSYAVPLAEAFREHCRSKGWLTAYTVTSGAFAERMIPLGYGAVEFGEELILDPGKDAQAGSKGRELRKKVNHAQRDGVKVVEYDRAARNDPALEKTMEGVAKAWLAARKGPQVFISRVRLFEEPEGRRWFYATHNGRMVGVLATLELLSRGGPLLEHHLIMPDAPAGTSELLVVSALEKLREEGCGFATFGPAPRSELGRIVGLTQFSEKVARKVFTWANTRFHLDARVRYRKKFQVAQTEASYLLFDAPNVGLRHIVGVCRAFNISLV